MNKPREYHQEDDWPGACCPTCGRTGLVCTDPSDGDKYYFCQYCKWNGHEAEVCEWVSEFTISQTKPVEGEK